MNFTVRASVCVAWHVFLVVSPPLTRQCGQLFREFRDGTKAAPVRLLDQGGG
jgi:hypothetical protein